MKEKLLNCLTNIALIGGICLLSYFDLYGAGWLIFILIVRLLDL
jgi:hypothetical protein|nr:MAG TPA: hypothetical protein [Caudoviricetes sp.]